MAPPGVSASPFAWHSSPIDWCEPNYAVSENVVEFWNTASCVVFFVYPPLLMWLFRGYSQLAGWGTQVLWGMLVVVGVGSVWFHGTLSYAGQLLDEFSIVWAACIGMALYTPRRILPRFVHDNKIAFTMYIATLMILFTVLPIVFPFANNMCQMTFSFIAGRVIWVEIRSCPEPLAKRLGWRMVFMWLAAVVLWVSDRVVCDAWLWVGMPGVHCVWHVLSLTACYWVAVFFAFNHSRVHHPHWRPQLAYWPNNSWAWLGVPYVFFKANTPMSAKHVGMQRQDRGHDNC